MKHPSKISLLLCSLVLTIYVMRHTDTSIGSGVTFALRRALDGLRPSQTLCGSAESRTFTASEIESAQNTIESVKSMRGGNHMEKWLSTGSQNTVVDDYVMPLIPAIAPWLVFLVISLISCTTLCCNWCCLHGCCKNKKNCCKCCRFPTHFTKKKIYIGVTILFFTGMFATAIAGLVTAPKIPRGMELTLCSFIDFTEDLAYGVRDKKWMGLQGTITSIDNVLAAFDATVSSLSATSDSTTAVQGKATDVYNALDTVYTTSSSATSPRASPDHAADTYVPIFIANLGPASTNTTATGSIKLEVELQEDVITTADPLIANSVNAIRSNSASIKSSIGTGRDLALELSNTVQELLETLGDTGKVAKDVISGIGAGLTAIFAVYLAMSLVSIASIVLFFLKKIKFLTKVLHFSWCLIIVLTLLGWLIGAIFYPLSIVMIETCDVLGNALEEITGEAYLDRTLGRQSGMEDIADVLKICIHRDGDMLAKFNLDSDSALGNFDTIFTQLTTVENFFPAGINSAPTSVAIPLQIGLATTYRDGTQPDHPDTGADLAALNSLVNPSINSGSCATGVQDTWNLNSAGCSGFTGTTFSSGNAATTGLPNPTCIGFNAYGSNTGGQRYTTTQFPVSCPSSNNAAYVAGFVDRFKANRQDVANDFGTILTNLNTVDTKYTDFSNTVYSVLTNFRSIKTNLAGVQDALDGETNGLLPNTKCLFVGDSMRTLTASMCTGFAVNLYTTASVIIAASFFTLFGTIALFCLLKRAYVPEYQKAKTAPSPNSPGVSPMGHMEA